MSGRVLVTGGTGAAGSATVKWLRRMGADVVVLARREPERPVDGVTYVQGDIQDAESVNRAVAGCSAVAHFAWTLSAIQGGDKANAIDIGGSTNVLRAMQDNDCPRMVFASSITVYGAHPEHPVPFAEYEPLRPAPSFHYERNKVQVETMFAESGLEAVSVRPSVVVGRSAWSAPAQIFRQPVVFTPGRSARMQLTHVDDLGRFFAVAALGGPTGPVNLVADDALTFTEIGHLVGRPVVNSGAGFSRQIANLVGKIPNADSIPDLLELFMHYPLGDTRRLREDFGFTCSYSSADAVADMTDWSSSQLSLGLKSFRKPTRLAEAIVHPRATTAADGSALPIVPAEYTGEFDSVTVDPKLPEWTAANLSEAFPGPMTPLSLGISMRIMFSAANLVTKLFPLDDVLAAQVSTKQVASIGHRLYNNMSVMFELSKKIPGQTPESFNNQMNGTPLPPGYRPPRLTAAETLTALRALLVAGPQIAGLGSEVAGMEHRAARLTDHRPDLENVSDEHLLRHIEQVTDLLVRAWDLACVNTFLVGAPITMIEQRYGEDGVRAVRIGTQNLRSAALLAGVCELAAMVNADNEIRRLIEETPREVVVAKLHAVAPCFTARLDRLIEECGHRGPGETELSNPVYADSPELLIRAVIGNLGATRVDAVPPVRSRVARSLINVAIKGIERRERGRDATIRITYELRLAVREWGRRLAERSILDNAGDVHYLSPQEIYVPPQDARILVTRRRAERERLSALNFPVHFSAPWTPETTAAEGGDVRVIAGLSVSPGIARGRVRIMRDADDELEAGDILVANVTDTGWTPFFGCAAAVVTNIGGTMSHAAIVAREFGIPAVVNTLVATRQLRDGQLVEVDGSSGTVRILDESPAPER
jgi:nucleoside-diphosphate-sugar epimerase/phosphohistidine swiveling domain-containing protein